MAPFTQPEARSFADARPRAALARDMPSLLDLSRAYVTLSYKMGGRERPEVDCYGLYRLFVGEQFGEWLDDYSGHTSSVSITKKLVRERANGNWSEIARRDGERLVYKTDERVGDLVLMRDVFGRGDRAIVVPFHCGVVVEDGIVMEILNVKGVLTRPFRDTLRHRAYATVVNRVIGVYRPAALQ